MKGLAHFVKQNIQSMDSIVYYIAVHYHTFGDSLLFKIFCYIDKSKFNIYQLNQRTRGMHKEHTRVNQKVHRRGPCLSYFF